MAPLFPIALIQERWTQSPRSTSLCAFYTLCKFLWWFFFSSGPSVLVSDPLFTVSEPCRAVDCKRGPLKAPFSPVRSIILYSFTLSMALLYICVPTHTPAVYLLSTVSFSAWLCTFTKQDITALSFCFLTCVFLPAGPCGVPQACQHCARSGSWWSTCIYTFESGVPQADPLGWYRAP